MEHNTAFKSAEFNTLFVSPESSFTHKLKSVTDKTRNNMQWKC